MYTQVNTLFTLKDKYFGELEELRCYLDREDWDWLTVGDSMVENVADLLDGFCDKSHEEKLEIGDEITDFLREEYELEMREEWGIM